MECGNRNSNRPHFQNQNDNSGVRHFGQHYPCEVRNNRVKSSVNGGAATDSNDDDGSANVEDSFAAAAALMFASSLATTRIITI
jgi:hypothetical protein